MHYNYIIVWKLHYFPCIFPVGGKNVLSNSLRDIFNFNSGPRWTKIFGYTFFPEFQGSRMNRFWIIVYIGRLTYEPMVKIKLFWVQETSRRIYLSRIYKPLPLHIKGKSENIRSIYYEESYLLWLPA